MSVVKFTAPVNTGAAFGNLIRTVMIEKSVAIKPIAYSLSDGSNQFKPSDNMRDIASFATALSSLSYKIDDNVDFPLAVDYIFKKQLTVKDLNSSDVTVISGEPDKVLLDTFDDKEVKLTLIFNRGCGYMGYDYNTNILNEANYPVEKFNILGTRFTDVTVSAPKIINKLTEEQVTLRITAEDGNEEAKFQEALNTIIEQISNIR